MKIVGVNELKQDAENEVLLLGGGDEKPLPLIVAVINVVAAKTVFEGRTRSIVEFIKNFSYHFLIDTV